MWKNISDLDIDNLPEVDIEEERPELVREDRIGEINGVDPDEERDNLQNN